jgi:predicted transcriptional regulator
MEELTKVKSMNCEHNIYILSNPIGSTMAATTTICVEPEVKERLKGLRIQENESYNSIVKRLVKNAYSDEPYTEEDVKDLETALKEIKEGKYRSHEDVWAEIDRERAKK